MDIDDFLDKEAQVEKRGEANVAANQETLKQESFEIKEPKPEPKRDESENGTIGLLEKQYFEIWENISQQKLLWNNELYKGVNSAADSIKEEAGKFLLKVVSDKKIARELIQKASKEIEGKNHESALALYSRIISIRDSIPDNFFEEKIELNEQLFQIYQALHKQIDSKLTRDLMLAIEKISSSVEKSFESIKKRSLNEAEKFYSESIESFKNLPHGFLLQKMEVGNNLLALYRELSIHTQIRSLQEQLMKDKSSINFEESEFRSYKLRQLSEIVRQSKEDNEKDLAKKYQQHALRPRHGKYRNEVLKKLVERKIERARLSLEKGFYGDAKKNIDAVLRLDPDNADAKKMLIQIPKQNL